MMNLMKQQQLACSETGGEPTIFVSYSRADNQDGWVSGLVARLEEELAAIAAQGEIGLFFDKGSIRQGYGWEQEILAGLRSCRMFLAVLSPNYFVSEWCVREWNWWVRHETSRRCVGEGAAPLYHLTIQGFPHRGSVDEIVAGLMEVAQERSREVRRSVLSKVIVQVQGRQLYDFRPFDRLALGSGSREDLRGQMVALREQTADLLSREQKARASARNSEIPSHNPCFSGRVENLAALRRDLALGVTGITAVINGLGGIGKTELSLAYAHAYAHEYPGGCSFISCAGVQDWREALERLADAKGWEYSDHIRQSIDRHFQALVRSMHEHARREGRMLLVCDNIDHLAVLRGSALSSLRLTDDSIHLLFTSRLEGGAADDKSHLRWHALDSLPVPEATHLLHDLVNPADAEAEEALAEIAAEFCGYTIAVELAGRHLRAHPEETAGELLAKLRRAVLAEQARQAAASSAELYRHDPAQVLGEHKGRIDFILGETLARLTEVEVCVLEHAAQLAPDAVPLAWVRELAGAEHPEIRPVPRDTDDARHAEAEQRWSAVVLRLLALRLLIMPQEETAEARIREIIQTPLAHARMHRLVQEVVRARRPDKARQARERTWALCKKNSRADYDARGRGEAQAFATILAAIASSGLDRAERGETDFLEHVEYVARFTTQHLQDKASLALAESIIRRSIGLQERVLGASYPDLSISLNNLACICERTDRLAEAEVIFRRAIEIDEAHSGTSVQSLRTLATHSHNFAILLIKMNQFDEALFLLRRELLIQQRVSVRWINSTSAEPVVVGALPAIAKLSEVLRLAGRHAEAEELIQQELARWPQDDKTLGSSLGLSDLMMQLALQYKATNRLQQARELYERILAVEERAHGADSPRLATPLFNLAKLYDRLEDYRLAERTILRAIDIYRAYYGENHSEVASGYSVLAQVYQSTNRLEEAMELLRKAIDINVRVYGPEHNLVGNDHDTLALCLQKMGNDKEAEVCFRKSLAICGATMGVRHSWYAVKLFGLVALLRRTGRLGESEEMARLAAEILEEAHGPTHDEYATALNELGHTLEAKGALDEALAIRRQVLEIDERSFGPDSPRVATDCGSLAHSLEERGDYGEAEALRLRAVAICEAAYGLQDATTIRMIEKLALLYRQANRLEEAVELSQKALRLTEAMGNDGSPEIAHRLNVLGLACWQQGKHQEAEGYLRRSVAIFESLELGDSHVIAAPLNNLGLAVRSLGNAVEAEQLFRRVVAIDSLPKNVGKQHGSDVGLHWANLGQTLYQLGKKDETCEAYQHALREREAYYGTDHAEVAGSLNDLAFATAKGGQIQDALPHIARATEILLRQCKRRQSLVVDTPVMVRNFWEMHAEAGMSGDEIFDCLQKHSSQAGLDEPLSHAVIFEAIGADSQRVLVESVLETNQMGQSDVRAGDVLQRYSGFLVLGVNHVGGLSDCIDLAAREVTFLRGGEAFSVTVGPGKLGLMLRPSVPPPRPAAADAPADAAAGE